MFTTYLRRELGNRRRQTMVVAIGLALAVALVMIVSSIAAGVRDAQTAALDAVYGVGTDLTITQPAEMPTEGGGGPRFEFGSGDGSTTDGTTTLSQSQLTTGFASTAFDASAVSTAAATDGVVAAAGSLALQSISFTGEIPDFTQQAPGEGIPGGLEGGGPGGGPDGAGGSEFGVETVSVTGADVGALDLGPLSSTQLVDGRGLEAGDAGAMVAVLDSSYATSSDLTVGDSIELGGQALEVVGIAASTSTTGESASNVFIPLDTAQQLAGLDAQVTTVFVQAGSADAIPAVQAALESALPEATVNSQSELASSVSGSLSSASSLIAGLGTWLSVIVLCAAFLIAILFTVSGVARRTREFGTLKAIGWSNRRIVGQVAGESFVTGVIGAAGGVAIGLIGVLLINVIAPTVSVAATTPAAAGPGGGGVPGGGCPAAGCPAARPSPRPPSSCSRHP